MNNSRYDAEQRKFLKVLEGLYAPWVRTGICIATIRACNEKPTDPCKGPIGYRHAIAKRHLNLIADADNRIRANKDIESFDIWTEQYPELQPVPISRFSAGKWSCQKHDERFAGIDAEHIDLSEPENLFKAVYRVVLRQNHLTAARWSAHWAETETEEGWKRFKETAFREPVSEEEAIKAASEWRNEAQALGGQARKERPCGGAVGRDAGGKRGRFHRPGSSRSGGYGAGDPLGREGRSSSRSPCPRYNLRLSTRRFAVGMRSASQVAAAPPS